MVNKNLQEQTADYKNLFHIQLILDHLISDGNFIKLPNSN